MWRQFRSGDATKEQINNRWSEEFVRHMTQYERDQVREAHESNMSNMSNMTHADNMSNITHGTDWGNMSNTTMPAMS